jgi:hypothetical protein
MDQPRKKRNRPKITDRPDVHAALVAARHLKCTSKHPQDISLEFVSHMVFRRTGQRMSRYTVFRGLVDHDLYAPWRRKTKKNR